MSNVFSPNKSGTVPGQFPTFFNPKINYLEPRVRTGNLITADKKILTQFTGQRPRHG
jgi:hypothetical protein